MKVLAIIPARGGSKGIPKKNLVEVANKPLIQWTIEAALQSKSIDTVVVSSDDDEILEYAKSYHQLICIKRPSELARDNSVIEPVINHVLEVLDVENQYDYLILLQPTSPLRTSDDINNAISLIANNEATSLISVTRPTHHPLKSFIKNEEGYLQGLVNNGYPFMPRQELPEVYQPNGAIYIVQIKEFLKSSTLLTKKAIGYMMTLEKSIDVDFLEDIENIENQLKKDSFC